MFVRLFPFITSALSGGFLYELRVGEKAAPGLYIVSKVSHYVLS